MFDGFFHREGLRGREQVLSPNETAKAVRDATINLIDYGSCGSDRLLPQEAVRGAVKLPTLLRFKQALQHFSVLSGVLKQPRDFQLADTPEAKWEEGKPEGDVVYKREAEAGHIYTFAHHLTSPYLNAFTAAIDRLSRRSPRLNVKIYGHTNGVWELQYGYYPAINFSISDPDYCEQYYKYLHQQVGHNVESPDKNQLLSFVFSPRKLDAQYFIDRSGCIKPYLRSPGETKVGDYRVLQLQFEAKRYAAHLKKEDELRPGKVNSDNSAEIYAFEKDGDRQFSIVELGKVNIGNLTYYVYSGAEQPLVQEKEPRQVTSPFKQTVLTNVTA